MKHGNKNQSRLTPQRKRRAEAHAEAIIANEDIPTNWGARLTGERTIQGQPVYTLLDGYVKMTRDIECNEWYFQVNGSTGYTWPGLAKQGIEAIKETVKDDTIPFDGSPVSPPEQGHDYGLQAVR